MQKLDSRRGFVGSLSVVHERLCFLAFLRGLDKG